MMTAQKQAYALRQTLALECMCGHLILNDNHFENLAKLQLFGAKAYCFCPICFIEIKDGDKDPVWRRKVDRFFRVAEKRLRKKADPGA
ncbi:MAG TPA: hypothetical protein PLR20_15640 [Syntrophales bacterium]|nr:hypothetical protein [Syntrophales bacterium]